MNPVAGAGAAAEDPKLVDLRSVFDISHFAIFQQYATYILQCHDFVRKTYTLQKKIVTIAK